MSTNKIYTCTNFQGRFPVGTAAVVVAPDRDTAEIMLHSTLTISGLNQGTRILKMEEINIDELQVLILNDGDY